jgi:toxin ParE1/3/4
MPSEVLLTVDAERDLEEILDFIERSDSRQRTDHVLERLIEVTRGLAGEPERGSHPKELRELGIREFRQAFFKPYRVIYRVMGDQVFVYGIADGRREMQALLARRLLGA